MTCEIARISGKKSPGFYTELRPQTKKKNDGDLAGGFKYFLCSPLPGEMIQFD